MDRMDHSPRRKKLRGVLGKAIGLEIEEEAGYMWEGLAGRWRVGQMEDFWSESSYFRKIASSVENDFHRETNCEDAG